MATETLHHGTSTELNFALHTGVCLAGEYNAQRYADDAVVRGDAVVYTVEIDLDGLTVIDAGEWDRDAQCAPGDDGNDMGADVLIFEDEDRSGDTHTTWRLMTPEALAAATIVATTVRDEDWD